MCTLLYQRLRLVIPILTTESSRALIDSFRYILRVYRYDVIVPTDAISPSSYHFDFTTEHG